MFANWDIQLHYIEVLNKLVTYELMTINIDWQNGGDIKRGVLNYDWQEFSEDIKSTSFIVPKLLWETRDNLC
jgi:hypothetical protein